MMQCIHLYRAPWGLLALLGWASLLVVCGCEGARQRPQAGAKAEERSPVAPGKRGPGKRGKADETSAPERASADSTDADADAGAERSGDAEQDAGMAKAVGEQAELALRLRIAGQEPLAEIGFRFSAPRDVDGDGWPDVAAGGRFSQRQGLRVGAASLWSGRTGRRLLQWDGDQGEALFGHATLFIDDVDGDGRADVLISAPLRQNDDGDWGEVRAYSSADGALLWRRAGVGREHFGWDLALTDDATGDGKAEILVGAPAGLSGGRVVLLDGADGTPVQSYLDELGIMDLGWYVDALEDVDGDGRQEVLIGAPEAPVDDHVAAGSAFAVSGAAAQVLWRVDGAASGALLGEVVAAVPDLSGDGVQDVAVSMTHLRAPDGAGVGQVRVYASTDGRLLRTLNGRSADELYGRFVGPVGDLNADGRVDVLIGAPWADERRGRFEVRSGNDWELLFERSGETPRTWLGWHAVAVDGHDDSVRAGVLVSAPLLQVDGLPEAGGLYWYALSMCAHAPGGCEVEGGRGERDAGAEGG